MDRSLGRWRRQAFIDNLGKFVPRCPCSAPPRTPENVSSAPTKMKAKGTPGADNWRVTELLALPKARSRNGLQRLPSWSRLWFKVHGQMNC